MDWIGIKEEGMGKIKKYRYVLLVLLAGIFLMALPEGKPPETVHTQPPAQTARQDLQDQLAELLEKLEGAGKVEVLLTPAAGERTLYQADEERSTSESSQDSRSKTVLVTGASREETGLISQVLPPTYRGAVVLCQGSDSARVRLSIVEAVSNATGLSTDKISVLKMK